MDKRYYGALHNVTIESEFSYSGSLEKLNLFSTSFFIAVKTKNSSFWFSTQPFWNEISVVTRYIKRAIIFQNPRIHLCFYRLKIWLVQVSINTAYSIS